MLPRLLGNGATVALKPAARLRLGSPNQVGNGGGPGRGVYIATYVPELASLPPEDRHEPWLARAKGADLGAYPDPIVDHATERTEALRRYDDLRA